MKKRETTPGEKDSPQISVRFKPETIDRLEAEAGRRQMKRAALVQRLVVAGLEGLPPFPAEPPVSLPVRRLGAWMAALDPAIRCKVREIGESLTLLYSLKRNSDGSVDLGADDGSVQNIWTHPSIPSRKDCPPLKETGRPEEKRLRRKARK